MESVNPHSDVLCPRLTVGEYRELVRRMPMLRQAGVELLEGNLVFGTRAGVFKTGCVIRLNSLFMFELVQNGCAGVQVSINNPLRLNAYDEPNVDMALVAMVEGEERTPVPTDILLAVAVAEFEPSGELRKIARFAGAHIPEAWLIDLRRQQVSVFTHPSEEGYQQRVIRTRGESVTPRMVPALGPLLIDEILGPLPRVKR